MRLTRVLSISVVMTMLLIVAGCPDPPGDDPSDPPGNGQEENGDTPTDDDPPGDDPPGNGQEENGDTPTDDCEECGPKSFEVDRTGAIQSSSTISAADCIAKLKNVVSVVCSGPPHRDECAGGCEDDTEECKVDEAMGPNDISVVGGDVFDPRHTPPIHDFWTCAYGDIICGCKCE
jgi:hypothetical protein